jgi:putative heme-binding domain-containing protein
MAVVYAPPISLNLKEIKAVVSYLMTLGGDLDMEAIDSAPSKITAKLYSKIAAAAEAGGGDPELGAEVYEDNCVDCHALGDDEDGEIGPNLSGIAATGLKFISESILAPTKTLTKGYETYVVINNEGRQFVGLKTRDGDGEVDITNALGDVETIAKSDIKDIRIDDTLSVMPDDISEVLTVKEYQDVLSFLMLQKPAEEE